MKLTFESPIFYLEGDENAFFHWLYSLDKYKEAIGHDREITISFREDLDGDTLRELAALFHQWHVDFSPLLALKNIDPEGNYWPKKDENC